MITQKNYDKNLKILSDYNLVLSERFLELLIKLNLDVLNMASVGNSISAGYSKCDMILPFLMRSHIYELSDNIKYLSFARIRRNEDKNILSWYNGNISHSEINDLNIKDILVKKDKYVQKYWNDQTIGNYENLRNNSGIGFKDFNKQNNSIIIYNGFTGEFTDTVRYGNKQDKQKILSTFEKDREYAKMVLTQIYADNPNTQVYVCGLPNEMHTGIISVLDKHIKEICEQIPNATYLPGTTRAAFFKLDGQKEFDIHYSQPEYLNLWNNILISMIENLIPNMFTISLIKRLENYSKEVDKDCALTKGDKTVTSKIIDEEIEKYTPLFEINNQKLEYYLDNLIKFYNENYLATFGCTPREDVMKKLLEIKNK